MLHWIGSWVGVQLLCGLRAGLGKIIGVGLIVNSVSGGALLRDKGGVGLD